MDNFERAYQLKDELIKDRRHIHQLAEVGFELPKTTKYVKDRLIELGYEPKEIIENGIVATIGKGGKTFLLRADMDALPMKEDSGLDFASTNGNSHSCGHDTHTAMLLTAAKMLKEKESELKGTVKLMFQPAEELLIGCEKMVKAGVLENPKVDCAMMFHISSTIPKGVSVLSGPRAASSNNFRIKVKGAGCHGAMPEKGIDPVLIGAHIVIGLQELVSREISFTKSATLTTGHFEAGSAVNIIPPDALIEGTMRTFDVDTQEHLKKRLPEVVKSIAETYRGTAEVEFLCDVPVMINDINFTNTMESYINDLSKGRIDITKGEPSTGSEDFAFIGKEVPATMLSLGAADPNSDTRYPLHNPKVVMDEDALPLGPASFVECAMRWLEENQ